MGKTFEDSTILVVDDDEMNLRIAKMILERKLSCKVLTANNGLSTLETLRDHYVDLVLLDIMMPELNGIETLQKIRDDENLRDIPVMMLTASTEMENIKKTAALGITDYIRKPFMPAELVERVSKKLGELNALEKVLIVDDDKTRLNSMRDIVEENFPYEVLIADSSAATTKILRDNNISLVIVGAAMKFIDGFEILNFMAHNEKFGAIPFVVSDSSNLRGLLDKIKTAETVEETSPVEPAQSSEKEEVVPPREVDNVVDDHDDKKKLANVVTTFIGYKLDVRT